MKYYAAVKVEKVSVPILEDLPHALYTLLLLYKREKVFVFATMKKLCKDKQETNSLQLRNVERRLDISL